MAINEKYQRLVDCIKGCGKVAVAFSGGVDSTLLLYAAREALGDNVLAVSVTSDFVPKWESKEAQDYCMSLRVDYKINNVSMDNIEGFKENPKNRCYMCKKAIFTSILNVAKENGIDTVIEGSCLDDLKDYRPGMQALKDLKIKSPFLEIGLGKVDIRLISNELNLPTALKSSNACLATRIAYGEEITRAKLKMVSDAEDFLRAKGYTTLRVRMHNGLARIEVPADRFDEILKIREEIADKFKEIGFTYITLDIMGFRSGSMNEAIKGE